MNRKYKNKYIYRGKRVERRYSRSEIALMVVALILGIAACVALDPFEVGYIDPITGARTGVLLIAISAMCAMLPDIFGGRS